MKTIAISGLSGFVGTNLKNYFGLKNFKIIKISRDDLKEEEKIKNIVEKADIVINLAGATIIKRWTQKYKQELLSSRIDTTSKIVKAINNSIKKPELFISTSAIGIYKSSGCHDENSTEFDDGFLGNLAKEWEKEALKAKNIRTIIFRFSVILGKDGGAFPKMSLPFKYGLGGKLGDGRSNFSYIHIDDLMRAYEFVMENKNTQGIYNLSTPNPSTNAIFTKNLGEILNKPTFFTVPNFMLKLIFGEGASVISGGQCVLPKRLLDAGFEFKYNNLKSTLKALLE